MHILLIAITALTAAVAMYADVRQRRLFNWLTLGSAAAGLLARLGTSGPPALLSGFEGWLLGIGLLVIPFAVGWMGAGDVKLLGAFGALGGPLFVQQTALYGCLAGAAAAIVWLAWQRKLSFTLRHFAVLVRHPGETLAEAEATLPFGAALSVGALASLALAGGAA